jgi:hypothetical protein
VSCALSRKKEDRKKPKVMILYAFIIPDYFFRITKNNHKFLMHR